MVKAHFCQRYPTPRSSRCVG